MGKLIIIDGTDRAGKATAVALTKKLLQFQGLRVADLSFPRYEKSFFADMVADFKAGKFGDPVAVNPYLASLPYILDRVDAKKILLDMLTENDVVLLDRYSSSNDLFQGAKCASLEELDKYLAWSEQVEFGEFGLPKPDLVILLETPPTFSQSLIRGEKDEHEKNVDYQKRVYHLMHELAPRKGWRIIPAATEAGFRPKEKIAADCLALIKSIF